MTTEPTTDEQKFLATLQECLQPDNDKRTAAEVCSKASNDRYNLFFFQAIYQEIPDEQKTVLLMSTLRNIALGTPVRIKNHGDCPSILTSLYSFSYEHLLLFYFDDYFNPISKISGRNIPLINKWL